MTLQPEHFVADVVQMHRETVDAWHEGPLDNRYDGLLATACEQHQFNFLLWHEEDIARSPDVTDSRIATVKRAIDGYNQQRNDWIEKIDDWISGQLAALGVAVAPHATQNTETPGSAIDRLSILALRIYHMEEQTHRDDVSPAHLELAAQKLAICFAQHHDLSNSLSELTADIFAGRRRHKTYRQLKMYNDPALNPYLYQAQKRLAG